MREQVFQDIFFKDDYFSDLNFFNIGHEVCSPGHKFGPASREYYLIHLIVKGQGHYQNKHISYRLKAGDFFVIKPNDMTEYQADHEQPWEYYWLGFTGENVGELLQLNGIAEHDFVGKIADVGSAVSKFEILLKLDLFDKGKRIYLQSLFLELFAAFKNTDKLPILNEKGNSSRYRDSFLLYIQSNYYRSELTLNEIAKSMYLHPAYFSQVIKEELGVTPSEYLISYRMNQAAFLLNTADLSIDEIAGLVGYNNRHSFSRAFKSFYGRPPSKFFQNNI